ncbi:MAG: tetratricopeptide repeat protein [Candidatus Nanoarchaeia archaeon]|nr:tetratricopeptide repeat protein [Candidatus Nanoarchaeia archaeon]MDD5054506.1 tetratricopeptide repeat protein [Candidatus Nanoarchaeia archaeon]
MSELRMLTKQEACFTIESFVKTVSTAIDSLMLNKQLKDVNYYLNLLENHSQRIDIGLHNDISNLKLNVNSDYKYLSALDNNAVNRITGWYNNFLIKTHQCIIQLPLEKQADYKEIIKIIDEKTKVLESSITKLIENKFDGLEQRMGNPQPVNNQAAAEQYYKNGILKKQQGQLAQAIHDFNEAINLKPTFFQAYLERGDAKLKMNIVFEALKDFDEVTRLNPSDERVYETKIKIKKKLIDSNPELINGLIFDLTHLLNLNPKSDNFTLRAELNLKLNNFNQAYEDAKKSKSKGGYNTLNDKIIYKSLIGLNIRNDEFIKSLNNVINNGQYDAEGLYEICLYKYNKEVENALKTGYFNNISELEKFFNAGLEKFFNGLKNTPKDARIDPLFNDLMNRMKAFSMIPDSKHNEYSLKYIIQVSASDEVLNLISMQFKKLIQKCDSLLELENLEREIKLISQNNSKFSKFAQPLIMLINTRAPLFWGRVDSTEHLPPQINFGSMEAKKANLDKILKSLGIDDLPPEMKKNILDEQNPFSKSSLPDFNLKEKTGLVHKLKRKITFGF